MIIKKIKIKPTAKQLKELQPIFNELILFNKKTKDRKLGLLFAQVYEKEITVTLLPYYKGAKMIKVLNQKPSGKIKRRVYSPQYNKLKQFIKGV